MMLVTLNVSVSSDPSSAFRLMLARIGVRKVHVPSSDRRENSTAT